MKDWAIHYIKAKDVFLKQLKQYNIEEDIIEFDFGEYKHYYLLKELLDKEIISKANKYEKKTIVCEKNEENFQFLINYFKELSEMKNLIIVFLTKDQKSKLLLNPRAHSLTADPENLEEGLRSIWNNS